MKDIFTITKNFLISCIIAIVVILIMAGCTNDPHKTDVAQDNNRFQTVYSQNFDYSPGWFYIIVDKETNVKYLYIKNGYGSGLTKLEE